MNSINKIFSLCFAISCFALAYLFYNSSNIPEGMFEDIKMYANSYDVNCAFCSCFEKGLKKYSNFITTPHDLDDGNISNCLTLIGLGYYDLLPDHPNFNQAKHMFLAQHLGWEEPFNKSLIKPKPKIENIVEWK